MFLKPRWQVHDQNLVKCTPRGPSLSLLRSSVRSGHCTVCQKLPYMSVLCNFFKIIYAFCIFVTIFDCQVNLNVFKSFSISFIHVIICPPLDFFLHIFFASLVLALLVLFLEISGDDHTNLAFAILLLYSMMSVSLFYKDDHLIPCLAI